MSDDFIAPRAAGSVPSRLEEPLQRTLRGLPDALLAALVSGLERHGNDLVADRLFTSRDGGGCAVGAMLRELRPADFEVGRLRFWWCHARRTSAASYGGVFASPRGRRHDHVVGTPAGERRAILAGAAIA